MQQDDAFVTQAIASFLGEINTSLPGTVVSYDGALAVVKPSIDKLFADGRQCSAPEIVSVPVVFPCGSGWRVAGPISPGDGVLLIFSQRALEAWHDAGDRIPNDPRIFSVSDAVAIPGLSPLSYYKQQAYPDASKNLVLSMGKGTMQLTPEGKLILDFPQGVEVAHGDVTVAQKLNVSAQITGSADIVASGISLVNHTHPVSGNTTGAPKA